MLSRTITIHEDWGRWTRVCEVKADGTRQGLGRREGQVGWVLQVRVNWGENTVHRKVLTYGIPSPASNDADIHRRWWGGGLGSVSRRSSKLKRRAATPCNLGES